MQKNRNKASLTRAALAGSALSMWFVQDSYNIAMPYLASFAREHAPQTSIRRCQFPISLDNPVFDENTCEIVLENDPEIVGLSCYCWDLEAQKKLARKIKKESPSTYVIIGGPSATFDAAKILKECPAIDAAVLGEGEATFAEILQKGVKQPENIKGIAYRCDSDIIFTQPRPMIKKLGTIPSPYLTGVIRPSPLNLMIEFSRGCIFKCRYCAWKNYMGGIRYGDLNLHCRELEWAIENGYKHCSLIDSALNFSDERMSSVCDMIRNTVPEGKMAFVYFIQHAVYHKRQLKYLEGILPREIDVGIESLNPDALRTAGRPRVDRERIVSCLDDLSRIGSVAVSIILGMPGDTLKGFKETVDFLASIAFEGSRKRIDVIYLFLMLITPGSYFSGNMKKFGIRTSKHGIPYMIGCSSFPEQDMMDAVRYLDSHPMKRIFRWEDVSPWVVFKRLEKLDIEMWGEETSWPIEIADVLPSWKGDKWRSDKIQILSE